MTELIAFCFLFILAVASPGNAIISPEHLYDAGLASTLPPNCREPSAGEKRERGLEPKGKAATFSIDGEFLCERSIFAYDERDSYGDFVLRQAAPRAQMAARQAALLALAKPELSGKVWSVEVKNGPSPLAAKVRRIYQAALTEALGAGSVARGSVQDLEQARLVVSLRPVRDADILFEVTAVATSSKGNLTWRL